MMKCYWNYFRIFYLCSTLALAPLTPTILLAEIDTSLDLQIADCKKKPASEWSSTMNKCVGTAAAKQTRNEADTCNALTDMKQREACHLALAEKKTNLSSDPNKLKAGNTDKSLMMNGAYSVVALINFAGAKGANSGCMSKNIFGITAIAGLATDVYLKMDAKKKTKALNDKFKLDVSNGASDSQIKALTYLKEEQETVVKIAGLEKQRNMVLTLGYGAAGVMAAVELTPMGQNPKCNSKEGDAKSDGAASNGSPAQGANPGAATAAAQTAPVAGAPAAGAGFASLTSSSIGILVMSGIGAVYSAILYKQAAKQEEESKENIVKINKIIKVFKDSYANYCPNGRESLNEPKCYCYNEDGKKNTNRTKSQTCVALWAKDSYRLAMESGDYSGSAQAIDPVGCVDNKGNFDEKCACTKFVNAKGTNSCMKANNIAIPAGLGVGFGSGLQTLSALANRSASGNPRMDLLSTTDLSQKAIDSKKRSDDIFKKLAPSLSPSALSFTKINDNNVDQYAAKVIGAKAMLAARQGSSSAIGFASSRDGDENMSALLKNAEQKAGLDLIGSGRGLTNKASSPKETLNFLGDVSSNNSQTQNFPETQKNYNYKDSDITKNSDSSIFEIISNRYIQSGLKRLFDN